MNNPLGYGNPFPSKETKYVYVKRVGGKWNGSVVDMSEEEAAAALKLHPAWVVLGPPDDMAKSEPLTTPVSHQLQCPICGSLLSTESELKRHKKSHE